MLVELQIGVATLESSVENLRKLGMDPVILLLSLYPKDLKSAYYSNAVTSVFVAVQFTIARLWNQPRCPPTDE